MEVRSVQARWSRSRYVKLQSPQVQCSLAEDYHFLVSYTDGRSVGLRYVDVSKPLPETADRTKGYDISLIAVLDEAKDALVYAHHPAHEK